MKKTFAPKKADGKDPGNVNTFPLYLWSPRTSFP